MSDSEKGGTRSRWTVAGALIGTGNALYAAVVLLLTYPLVVGVLDSGSAVVVLVHIVVFVSFIVELVAGIGLALKARWCGYAIAIAAIGLVLGWGIFVAITGQPGWWLPAVPAVLSVAVLSLPQFDIKMRPGGKPLGLRPVHFALVLGGLALAYLVSVEAGSISKDLQRSRLEARCEEGSLQDCRQAAMLQLRFAEDLDAMKAAEARFAPLCEKGNASACRSIGYARSDYFAHLGPPREMIEDRVQRIGSSVCQAGDGRGCAVAVWFTDVDRTANLAKAEELCRDGDRDACIVWIQLRGETEDAVDRPEVPMHEVACKAGLQTMCKPTPKDARARCLAGELEHCAEAAAAKPELQPLADAHRTFGNPGLYGLVPPPAEHEEQCDAGDALACLFRGLELLGDVPKPPAEIAPLPAATMLDATIGQACDAGLAVACLAYGFRLLDRGATEERDFSRANSWLQKGCDLGSQAACREISFEPQLQKHDFAGFRAQRQAGCMNTGDPFDCRSYLSVLAFDIGATPWPISDDIAYVHLRHACTATGNPMACTNAAYFVEGLDITPEYQLTALDLARFACQKRYAEGCQTMFRSSGRWWPEHEQALRARVCPKVPAACGTPTVK